MLKNMLYQSRSTYLLQHAENPVHWQEWSSEVLDFAQMNDSLLIISIGYSACHWCHVMERESFEKEEVADAMNAHYVSIKIDREEHPDLDHIYMTACQYSSGKGGWPLNVIALPDGRPIYAGTYFKKTDWLRVLDYFQQLYKSDKNKVLTEVEKLARGISQNFSFKIYDEKEIAISWDEIGNSVEKSKSDLDMEWGGSLGAPKFPMPVTTLFYLKYNAYSNDATITHYLKQTAYRMAMGGIYDHVGGGFARYSVDKYWVVPHFEKMLYDNAQLLSFYSKMFGTFKDDFYKKIATEIHIFLEEEMRSDEGLYYSAIDADSEGVEGKYYCFEQDEMEVILENNSAIFCEYFNLQKDGNWESTNILFRDFNIPNILNKYEILESELEILINKCLQKIKEIRALRIAPQKDTKIITAWNALTALGYMDLYEANLEAKYLSSAKEILETIWSKMFVDGQLYRCRKDRSSYKLATLDDAAFLLQALLNLYQYTFDEKYFLWAETLRTFILQDYFDIEKNVFYFNSKKEIELFVRPTETSDNVTPAATSMLLQALFIFDTLVEADKTESSLGISYLHNFKKTMLAHPRYYAQWMSNSMLYIQPVITVCIIGENAQLLRDEFFQKKDFDLRLHQVILLGSSADITQIPYLRYKLGSSKTQIFICAGEQCFAPVHELDEALEMLNSHLKPTLKN